MPNPKLKRSIYLPVDIANKYPTQDPKDVIKAMWDKAIAIERGVDTGVDTHTDLLDLYVTSIDYTPTMKVKLAVIEFWSKAQAVGHVVKHLTKLRMYPTVKYK
jgi:hypothetical protein